MRKLKEAAHLDLENNKQTKYEDLYQIETNTQSNERTG